MKKGFTLIELLAVIVILAIIALIATPIVLSIIDDSKESSMIRSAEGYLRAVEYEVAQAYVTANRITEGTYYVLSTGDICIDGYTNNTCTGKVLEIEYNNEGPISGSITFEDTKIVHYTFTYPSGITVVDGRVGDEIEQLAPGLYDENDKLLISWDDLTSVSYKSITYENEDGEEITSAILNIDEDGVLSSTFDSNYAVNYSDEYLIGKLVIDDSVTSIGDDAFNLCESLTSVIIPNSVTTIGDYAFFGCIDLTSVIIGNSVTSIGDSAFNWCESLTSVIIGNRVTSIGREAFYVTGLETITIPDSVTSIGYGAFEETNLKSLVIPKSVTSINGIVYAFSSVSSIKVDENNPVYDSRDNSNAIIETATNTLISGCDNTIIPNTVTSIGGGAFLGSSNMESIVIPVSVTSIGAGAFMHCESLAAINYRGTEEQWNAISKANDWDMDIPGIEINYNYTGE